MAEITEPIMLDQTGQDIVGKLELIKQAIQNQTNVPIATQSTPGIVKPGADMSVSADGTLNIGDTIARSDVISDKYNASKTYTSGEYLIHNDILYRVLNTCQGITPPNASYYAPCTVGAEVSALKSTIDHYTESTSSAGFTVRKYDNGDLLAYLHFTESDLNAFSDLGSWLGNANHHVYSKDVSISDIGFVRRPVCQFDAQATSSFPWDQYKYANFNWNYSTLSVRIICNDIPFGDAYVVLQGKWK